MVKGFDSNFFLFTNRQIKGERSLIPGTYAIGVLISTNTEIESIFLEFVLNEETMHRMFVLAFFYDTSRTRTEKNIHYTNYEV